MGDGACSRRRAAPFSLSLLTFSLSLSLSSLSLSSHFLCLFPCLSPAPPLSLPPSGGGPQDTAHKPDQASESQRQRPWLLVIDQIERHRERESECARARAQKQNCTHAHTNTHFCIYISIYTWLDLLLL